MQGTVFAIYRGGSVRNIWGWACSQYMGVGVFAIYGGGRVRNIWAGGGSQYMGGRGLAINIDLLNVCVWCLVISVSLVVEICYMLNVCVCCLVISAQ